MMIIRLAPSFDTRGCPDNKWIDNPGRHTGSLCQLGIDKIAAWHGSVPQAVSERFAKGVIDLLLRLHNDHCTGR